MGLSLLQVNVMVALSFSLQELKGPVGQIQHCDRMVYAVEQNKVLVPGNSNRYLAWGYADQSFRLGNYESDKAVFVCEPNYLVGQVNVGMGRVTALFECSA